MPVTVRTPWGEETYPSAQDWDVDHDHDLALYAQPLQQATEAMVVYPAGQWLRVATTPPTTTT